MRTRRLASSWPRPAHCVAAQFDRARVDLTRTQHFVLALSRDPSRISYCRMTMASTTFTVEVMVRGYHVYRAVWDANNEEELLCERESGKPHDPYAVAIARAGVTVGHVPRKISSVCSLFLRRGGSIRCQVTGSRRYSQDLPQGELEL